MNIDCNKSSQSSSSPSEKEPSTIDNLKLDYCYQNNKMLDTEDSKLMMLNESQ